MKDLSRWPLDGLISFIACVAALICLVGARLVDLPRRHAAQREGNSFPMRPLPSNAVTAIGLILIIGTMTYGVSQAGRASHNQHIGMLVVGAFWVMGAYFLYAHYLVRYSFDAEGFNVMDSLRGTQRYPWESLVAVGYKNHDPILHFPGKGYRLPHGLSGRRQLVCLVDSKILRLKSPHLPVYDEPTLRGLIGTTGLVKILHADAMYHSRVLRTSEGTINSIQDDRVAIRFEDGSLLEGSANLRSVRPGSGQHVWIASWYVDPSDSI